MTMRKSINIEHIKNADKDVSIGDGIIQHLTFNPSKDFADGNVRLFGISVKQQGRKLIIIMKIYDEERREEIIRKSEMMTKMMITLVGKRDIDTIHIVDSKDVLDQLSKYRMTADKFAEDIEQEKDVTIETIDLITGEMVSVVFGMKLVNIDKGADKKTS